MGALNRGLLGRRDAVAISGVAAGVFVVLFSIAMYLEGVAHESIMTEVREGLKMVATIAAHQVPAEELGRIREPADRDELLFARIYSKFTRIRADLPELKAIYTIRPTDDPEVWKFIVDSDPDDKDKDGDGVISEDEQGTLPGDSYEVPEGAKFDEALKGPAADDDFTVDQWGTSISGYAPIRDASGKAVAIIGVDLDKATVQTKLLSMRLGILGATCVMAFLSVLAFLMYIQQRRAYRRAMTLQQQYVAMKVQLSKFVPENVRRIIEQDPESPAFQKVERDVTVAFIDLSGYTRLSEVMPGARLNTLVEHYLSAFLDIVHGEGGDVTETAGDGFMSIFQNGSGDEHARAAVRAAIAIIEKTRDLNADRNEPILVHVGVNSGTGLVGATQLESTTVDRWTFTATGPVTNLAARIAAAAHPGGVWMSAETAQRVGDEIDVRSLGAKQFKNVSKPVEVFAALIEGMGLPERSGGFRADGMSGNFGRGTPDTTGSFRMGPGEENR